MTESQKLYMEGFSPLADTRQWPSTFSNLGLPLAAEQKRQPEQTVEDWHSERQCFEQQHQPSVWPRMQSDYGLGASSVLLPDMDEASWSDHRRHLVRATMNTTAQQQQQQQQNLLHLLHLPPLPPRPGRTFQPMQMLFRRQQPDIRHFSNSSNYRGDVANPHNRGDHVPEAANTSLFLTNLPTTTSVGDLLRAVATLGPTGRVFSASVSPPDPTRGHRWAAAKLSFFTRAGAEALKNRIDRGELVGAESGGGDASYGFCSSTHAPPLRAIWNRDRKPPRMCVQADECRVLRIRGPAETVNYATLTAYFEQKFYYELEAVIILGPEAHGSNSSTDSSSSSINSGGRPAEAAMEWRFASFQSQAIAAKMALNQEMRAVRVEYGQDPCERGWP